LQYTIPVTQSGDTPCFAFQPANSGLCFLIQTRTWSAVENACSLSGPRYVIYVCEQDSRFCSKRAHLVDQILPIARLYPVV
jgi:hypothetical protein